MNARTDIRPMGVVHGMSFEEYLAIDALSQSALKLLSRSPWHYANRVEVKQTRPMLNGTLVHCARLEPDALSQRYVVVPEDAPKRPTDAQWAAKKSNESSQAAKEWWTAFGEEVAGRTIIPADDFAITQLQLKALNANATIADVMSGGHSEVSVFWVDKATGVYCKARPDYVRRDDRGDTLTDLKSVADESPSGFSRAAARMQYHLQAAHYMAGWGAATGRRVQAFVFAAVTSVRPVLAVPYVLTDEVLQQGEEEREELLTRFANCKQSDTWPAYGDGLQPLDFPAYAKAGGEIEISDIE